MILNISKIVFYHYTLFSVDQRCYYCKVGLLKSKQFLFVLLYNNILYWSFMDHSVLSFLMISIVFYFEIMFGTAGVKLGYSTRVCSIGPSKNKNCLFDANKSAKRRDGRLPCLKAIVSNAPLLRSIKDTDAWTDAPLCLCLANSTPDFLFIFFFYLFFHSSNYFVTK